MILRPYQIEAVERLLQFYSVPRELDKDGKPERKNALLCMPTGTGKSIVIAAFLQRAFDEYQGTRVIMATHVKELISQNAAKLIEAWPQAPLGIFSAGLKARDILHPIIFGGIQSMAGKLLFGHRDFLIIDEAHLVGKEGQYLALIAQLTAANPFLKIIGLTATGWRLGLGKLTNGPIFTNVVFDICGLDSFNRLIAEGYLCPLIPKRGAVEINTSGVSIASTGDFNVAELDAAIKDQGIYGRALAEFVAHGNGRNSWLVFANSVEAAEEIGDMLEQQFNVDNVVLHSKKSDKENAESMRAWKAGEVRCAVNMGMLTTGVDNPALDLIGMLRPTTSSGLWVQMLGRGTRPNAGKTNCLVLDFAGNTRRLGPVNDPVIPKLKGKGTGDAPVKLCPSCSCYNHLSARYCVVCGAEFIFEHKLADTAYTDALLKSDIPIVEMLNVRSVLYAPHIGMKSGKPSIKVSYLCGLRTYTEWVSVEGIAGRIRGRNWFRQRFASEPPATNAEVLQMSRNLRMPSKIRVWMNKTPYPEVLAAEF